MLGIYGVYSAVKSQITSAKSQINHKSKISMFEAYRKQEQLGITRWFGPPQADWSLVIVCYLGFGFF